MYQVSRSFRPSFQPLVALVSLAALLACGGGSGGGQPILRLALGADQSLPKGTTLQLTAAASLSDGAAWDCTIDATWSSSDPAVAAVQGGLVTAVGEGTAVVSATCSGAQSTVQVTVTGAVLVSIAVASPAPLPAGATAQLSARGTYSDASEHDLTLTAAWSSSDETRATVSSDAATAGLVTGVSPGDAVVTAAVGAVAGTAAVTVLAPQLATVDVAPIDPVIDVGSTVALGAAGTYTDDSTADLTSVVTWTSSDPLVVTVSATGVATGVAPGSATITATEPGTGLSATTIVTVVPAWVPVQLAYLSLSRGSISGGGTVTGTVVLTRAAEADMVVALATSDPVATVPASVTVPVGADRATFDIATTQPARRKIRVAITATAEGVTKIAKLNVRR